MILHTQEGHPAAGLWLDPALQQRRSGQSRLSDEIAGEVFEAIRDPAVFASASQHPVMRTVPWADGANLPPEFLLDLMRTQQDNRIAEAEKCRVFRTYLDGEKTGFSCPSGVESQIKCGA